jgi:hypothetical protein
MGYFLLPYNQFEPKLILIFQFLTHSLINTLNCLLFKIIYIHPARMCWNNSLLMINSPFSNRFMFPIFVRIIGSDKAVDSGLIFIANNGVIADTVENAVKDIDPQWLSGMAVARQHVYDRLKPFGEFLLKEELRLPLTLQVKEVV